MQKGPDTKLHDLNTYLFELIEKHPRYEGKIMETHNTDTGRVVLSENKSKNL